MDMEDPVPQTDYLISSHMPPDDGGRCRKSDACDIIDFHDGGSGESDFHHHHHHNHHHHHDHQHPISDGSGQVGPNSDDSSSPQSAAVVVVPQGPSSAGLASTPSTFVSKESPHGGSVSSTSSKDSPASQADSGVFSIQSNSPRFFGGPHSVPPSGLTPGGSSMSGCVQPHPPVKYVGGGSSYGGTSSPDYSPPASTCAILQPSSAEADEQRQVDNMETVPSPMHLHADDTNGQLLQHQQSLPHQSTGSSAAAVESDQAGLLPVNGKYADQAADPYCIDYPPATPPPNGPYVPHHQSVAANNNNNNHNAATIRGGGRQFVPTAPQSISHAPLSANQDRDVEMRPLVEGRGGYTNIAATAAPPPPLQADALNSLPQQTTSSSTAKKRGRPRKNVSADGSTPPKRTYVRRRKEKIEAKQQQQQQLQSSSVEQQQQQQQMRSGMPPNAVVHRHHHHQQQQQQQPQPQHSVLGQDHVKSMVQQHQHMAQYSARPSVNQAHLPANHHQLHQQQQQHQNHHLQQPPAQQYHPSYAGGSGDHFDGGQHSAGVALPSSVMPTQHPRVGALYNGQPTDQQSYHMMQMMQQRHLQQQQQQQQSLCRPHNSHQPQRTPDGTAKAEFAHQRHTAPPFRTDPQGQPTSLARPTVGQHQQLSEQHHTFSRFQQQQQQQQTQHWRQTNSNGTNTFNKADPAVLGSPSMFNGGNTTELARTSDNHPTASDATASYCSEVKLNEGKIKLKIKKAPSMVVSNQGGGGVQSQCANPFDLPPTGGHQLQRNHDVPYINANSVMPRPVTSSENVSASVGVGSSNLTDAQTRQPQQQQQHGNRQASNQQQQQHPQQPNFYQRTHHPHPNNRPGPTDMTTTGSGGGALPQQGGALPLASAVDQPQHNYYNTISSRSQDQISLTRQHQQMPQLIQQQQQHHQHQQQQNNNNNHQHHIQQQPNVNIQQHHLQQQQYSDQSAMCSPYLPPRQAAVRPGYPSMPGHNHFPMRAPAHDERSQAGVAAAPSPYMLRQQNPGHHVHPHHQPQHHRMPYQAAINEVGVGGGSGAVNVMANQDGSNSTGGQVASAARPWPSPSQHVAIHPQQHLPAHHHLQQQQQPHQQQQHSPVAVSPLNPHSPHHHMNTGSQPGTPHMMHQQQYAVNHKTSSSVPSPSMAMTCSQGLTSPAAQIQFSPSPSPRHHLSHQQPGTHVAMSPGGYQAVLSPRVLVGNSSPYQHPVMSPSPHGMHASFPHSPHHTQTTFQRPMPGVGMMSLGVGANNSGASHQPSPYAVAQVTQFATPPASSAAASAAEANVNHDNLNSPAPQERQRSLGSSVPTTCEPLELTAGDVQSPHHFSPAEQEQFSNRDVVGPQSPAAVEESQTSPSPPQPEPEPVYEAKWNELPDRALKCLIGQLVCLEGSCVPLLARLSNVATQWHQIIRANSDLWTHLDLSAGRFSEKFRCDKRLEQFMSRFHHVQEIKLNGWKNSVSLSTLKIVASTCSQTLTSLSLASCYKLNVDDVKFVADHFVNLHRIDLSNVSNSTCSSRSAVSSTCLSEFIAIVGKRLTHFNLSSNKMSGLPFVFKALSTHASNLLHLDISNITTTTRDPIYVNLEKLQKGCPRLEVINANHTMIDLSDAPIKDQIQAPGFPRLRELHIAVDSRGYFDGLDDSKIERILKKSDSLRHLDIRGCQNVTDSCLVRLPSWDVERLILAGSSAASSSIDGLELMIRKWVNRLVDIDIGGAASSARAVSFMLDELAISDQSVIRRLNLYGTAVNSKSLLRMLRQRITTLDFINLAACRAVPKELAKLHNGPENVKQLLEMLEMAAASPPETKVDEGGKKAK